MKFVLLIMCTLFLSTVVAADVHFAKRSRLPTHCPPYDHPDSNDR